MKTSLPENRHIPKKDKWRLDRYLADNSVLLSMSLVLNLIFLLVLFIQPIFIAQAASRTVQVAVIDPHGSIYSTQTERLLESSSLVKLASESFILAAYSKSPAGIKFSEMLHAVSASPVWQAYEKYWNETEAADFAQRQIHQSPEIGQIRILSRASSQVVALVEGQLVRSGVVQGVQFSESLPFKITLTLKIADSHTHGLNYPLQVVGTNVEIAGKHL